MRILIVEDNEVSANILESNLKQHHCDTVVASNGAEALRLLEAHWDICMVLADIMMPDLDGLELVRRMREDARWREIPVVICSSLADADHVAEAARLGCRHYLLKPVDRVQLLNMVDKIMASEKPKPILEERARIQAKYGLTDDSLNQILKAFFELLEKTLKTLESGPAETIENVCSSGFARLVEGSVTLGAQRLLMALKACHDKGARNLPECGERQTLLAEIKLIRRAIAAQAGIQTPQSAGDPPAASAAGVPSD